MRVLLYGRYGHYPKEIEPLIKAEGLEIVSTNPDVVITYGGDGTLIGSERDYPQIPKLPLKNSSTASKSSPLSNEETIKLLVAGKLQVKTYPKIEATLGENVYTAANDVVVRNSSPNIALRFSLSVNQKPLVPGNYLIGDGIVAATPFGSSGYFYSITRQTFPTGIGLALNNIHNVQPVVNILSAQAVINVKIIRGPAVLAVDNSPEITNLTEDQMVTIRQSPQLTSLLVPGNDLL